MNGTKKTWFGAVMVVKHSVGATAIPFLSSKFMSILHVEGSGTERINCAETVFARTCRPDDLERELSLLFENAQVDLELRVCEDVRVQFLVLNAEVQILSRLLTLKYLLFSISVRVRASDS